VQDLYLTETARLADVVLPAAGWGEKAGTFTNADRTVHFSGRAVDPPGQARSDLDIFLDYARRMGFRRLDGSPLLAWTGPEDGFRAWQDCSRGRPCDYSGLSYARLEAESGIRWPCTPTRPEGTERLYTDGRFPTTPEEAEDYGHDLLTGAPLDPEGFLALRLDGRARLRPAEYKPPHEEPDDEYPFRYTTGRTVYHFHTRTKTARTAQLQHAAPGAWAELSRGDADRLGVGEGDLVKITSRRSAIVVPARIGGGPDGMIFVPFHYGDLPGGDAEPTAANEVTADDWDPVSKQPTFKLAAARVEKVADGRGPAPAPTTTASRPLDPGAVPPTLGGVEAVVEETLDPGSVTRGVRPR
jgi:predicted molibdopterin-dependent oxidoreductase YjgC